LVANGIKMVTDWMSGLATTNYTYPTKIEIGESTAAVQRTDNGCIAAVPSPSTMQSSTGVVLVPPATTTKANDTFRISKVASPFDNTGGTLRNITEGAVKNTDGTPKALCRALSTAKAVDVNEQLAVTYNMQVLTSAA